MKKTLILSLIGIFILSDQQAQPGARDIDHQKELLSSVKSDTARFRLMQNIFESYLFNYPDSAVVYAQQLLLLALRSQIPDELCTAYHNFGWCYIVTGNYPQAMRSLQSELMWAEKAKSKLKAAAAYDMIAAIYADAGDYHRALDYERASYSIIAQLIKKDTIDRLSGILNGMATALIGTNQLDSAIWYIEWAERISIQETGHKWSPLEFLRGNIFSKKRMLDSAAASYYSGVRLAYQPLILKDVMDNYTGLAYLFNQENMQDSAIYYARKVLDLGKKTSYSIARLKMLSLLSDIYKSKQNVDSVAKYLELTMKGRDSLFSMQKIMEIQNMSFEENLRKRELEEQELEYKNKLRTYLLSGGILAVLLLAAILYRNNLVKQKAKSSIEKAYGELKSTQAQLIQSEKMASLGELTAGIAHEIQNPLNFVNNFSEVNTELFDEMEKEFREGKTSKAFDIARDIRNNMEKISQHGKRADAIVKSMMQHSNASAGHKELKNMNALAEEYLRLSFHGMRARDNNFHCEIRHDFDHNIGQIWIVPQDIGRVFLNLFNNAFYSVHEKKKNLDGEFVPLVMVTTRKIEEGIEIRIKDNGLGVPQKNIDKIFQPFFTTKPTGQGTGLGLSLSYDIITKEHQGSIRIETMENEFAEFIIGLPLKENA